VLNAIGPSASPGPAGVDKSTAGLEARLDQYKIKLADWVSCPSCKTPEGKAKISEISDKISEIRTRIDAITASKSNTQPAPPNAKTPAGIAANRDALVPASASGLATATVGSRLDTFA